MCTKRSKRVSARSAKMKRVTLTLAKCFVCEQGVETIKEPDKVISFFDQVKFVKRYN